ncbi:MAG: hypothetical protein JWQ48_771 [Conexibacter sp.]|jgi:hypothetical protein|nr:hypothetical protein [Conexibacter sp.]
MSHRNRPSLARNRARRGTSLRTPRAEAAALDLSVTFALDTLAPVSCAAGQRDWADVLRRAGVRTRACREALGWGTRPL